MRVLLIGSGGREHALAWKLQQSPLLSALYIAPGNPGTAQCGTNVALDVTRHADVVAFCQAQKIDLVIIGPEAPLVAGIVDDLERAGIRALGPTRAAAQLEGSKAFTKELCVEANIPTAAFARFNQRDAAKAYVHQHGAPIVIKADGLAAGKGVVVAMTKDEAFGAIDDILGGSFGAAGAEIVIEEYLVGEEASFFALSDGENVIALASAQDHKRVGDGDTGPNTGGMGAYSPAPIMTREMEERVMVEMIRPTIATMKKRGMPFRGILFAGLMITKGGPKLIEYNTRFGDPECEVLMPRLQSDLLDMCLAVWDGRLKGFVPQWIDQHALTVIFAANGYPAKPEIGTVIGALDDAEQHEGVRIFHAGTKLGEDGTLLANGGRVLAVTGQGPTLAEAQSRTYRALHAIHWPGGFYRKDIGWRALSA